MRASGGFNLVICGECGGENPSDHRFCSGCGSALSSKCPHCGSAVSPGHRFCGNCGEVLSESTPQAAGVPEEPASRPGELRLVSVLFCDLVGSTAMAEHRDDDEFRELLAGYYDEAKTVVALYGGVIQKFIGDAVVAVWGTPRALEDDAGRAVRAALDLSTRWRPRAAGRSPGLGGARRMVTGRAAAVDDPDVIVVGDRVNTAARCSRRPSRVMCRRRCHLRGHTLIGGLLRRRHLRSQRQDRAGTPLEGGERRCGNRPPRPARRVGGPFVVVTPSSARSRSSSTPLSNGVRPGWCP